ncbi:ABC transporter permease, partial [Halorubrum sp. SP3]
GGPEEVEARVGLRYTLKQVRQDTTARIGTYIVGFMTFVAIFAAFDYYILDYAIAEAVLYNPEADPENVQRLLPPVGMENQFGQGIIEHPLGTDHRGRDLLSRTI